MKIAPTGRWRICGGTFLFLFLSWTFLSAADYADLLRKYVDWSGVSYAAWKASDRDLRALDEVVATMAQTQNVTLKDSANALAFWINAYNANMLREMLHRYPVKGPIEGTPNFFKETKITVDGRTMSFDQLETVEIRERFRDPRIHFAVNCASRSCPPLQPEPFQGRRLEEQLNAVTRRFVNHSQHVILNNQHVYTSKIFSWYEGDFQEAGGVIAFINRYRSVKIPENLPLRFMDYDWSLNEKNV